MVKGGFFRDVCCRREAWLGEENIFGIWDNLGPASPLGEMVGGGVAIPGDC